MKPRDLTNRVFGRLTALSRSENKSNRATVWLCVCMCGSHATVMTNHLIAGHTKSCGCLVTDSNKKRNTTHGHTNHKLYWVWSKMKGRCTNKNDKKYHNYGGRGITVCKKWSDSFAQFLEWSIDNGWQAGLQIDREDNNKGYSPSNCRYVNNAVNICNSQLIQANNRSGYRGVHFDKYLGKWRAQIQKKRLGVFDSPLNAALYRDAYSIAHGNFLPLNFPWLAI